MLSISIIVLLIISINIMHEGITEKEKTLYRLTSLQRPPSHTFIDKAIIMSGDSTHDTRNNNFKRHPH